MRNNGIDLLVVLASSHVLAIVTKLARNSSSDIWIEHAETLEKLEEFVEFGAKNPLLISIGTSVVVPNPILGRFSAGAVNFHGGSPAYPGRDPHHFAAYDQCSRYGATAHIMAENVDEGPILDVEEEPMASGAGPEDYLSTGKRCLMRLLSRVVPRLLFGDLRPVYAYSWRGEKRSRQDFLSFCEIDPLSDENEIKRRVYATEASGYSNAYLDLAGYRFRVEGRTPAQTTKFRYFEEDFTESAYSQLLDRFASRYRFIGFLEAMTVPEHSVLWRHDIDFSVHRARRLAALEAERGLLATYFVRMGGPFYNALEPGLRQLLREITEDGHQIGLHFDPSTLTEGENNQAEVEKQIVWEAEVLGAIIAGPVVAVSIHNPTPNLPWLNLERLGGMINAYGSALGERYSYVSDSNGIWRHLRLGDVLAQEDQPYLHVLTHPGWWVPMAMPARARARRAIEGRARRVMQDYDRRLAKFGRPNVR